MAGLDVSNLSPDDAIAALRSFPRRYRAAIAVDDDADVDELAGRVGPAGRSGHDALVDATSSLVVLTEAVRQVLRQDAPLLHPAATDPSARDWAPPPGVDVATLADMLDDELGELTSLAEQVATFDWDRTGTVAGGGDVSALDLVREAVRTASEDLRVLEAAMGAASA